MNDFAFDYASWTDANNRYLAASLHWLRLRLQALAETPGPAQPKPGAASALAGLWRSPAPTALPTPLSRQIAAAADEREQAARIDPPPALPALAARMGLSDFETDVLLLCVACELDPYLLRPLAAAQSDPGAAYPSFGLALRLFDDPRWDALSPQRPLRYLRLLEAHQPASTPLTAAVLRADERIVNAVKGLDLLDERLSELVGAPLPPRPVSPSQRERVTRILAELGADSAAAPVPVVQLLGGDRGSRLAIASQVCAGLGRHLYVLPVQALPVQRSELETFARLWQRECLLLPVALYIEADEAEAGEHAVALAALLRRPLGLVFVGARETGFDFGGRQRKVEAPQPTVEEQFHAWRDALPPALDETERAAQAAQLCSQFRLGLDRIADAAASSRRLGSDPWDVCRDLAAERLDALAQKLEPKARWQDLVLAEESLELLRRIVAQVRERHRVYQQWGYAQRMNRGLGISALFSGESGTGKTMAAEVVANELRLHLFRIDLSSVVSKYIGETEKNLRRLFDAAEQGGAILFFDEADALFGKRSEVKDSHDRYANIEINYLLQRMESFSGLAILATNMKSSLDGAFLRRLRFVVNFAFPGPAERKRIWQNALPQDVPSEGVDADRLARFNLSGGNIHAVALNAAFAAASDRAAVDMQRVLAAVRTELRKLGKPVNESEFR